LPVYHLFSVSSGSSWTILFWDVQWDSFPLYFNLIPFSVDCPRSMTPLHMAKPL
jgi:hypothetical protein